MKVNSRKTIQNKMVRKYTELEETAINDTIYLCVVALNQNLGIGKTRLNRFADKLNEVTEWFSKMKQEDGEEYAHIKLAQLLEQITGDTYEVPLSARERRIINGTNR